jgi:adenylate cyclase
VLGDAVNVAARLQELSGKFEIPVVIGPATRTALAGWPCREIDQVVVRGRSERITIYEPLAPEP